MENHFIKLLLNPSIVINKLSWYIEKKYLLSVGDNVSLGRFFEIKGHEFISIGDNVVAKKYLKLHAWNKYKKQRIKKNPNLVVGSNVSFGDNCYLTCANQIIVEDNVLMGDNVFITDNFHGNSSPKEVNIPPADREIWSKGGVRIKSNVWLGRNVCVMPGVTIGYGSVIGANSVVTKDIPSRCIAVGSPAIVIRKIE
ncbi:Galactoside O-acetyltransferase [Streptococcus thermophilus]|uniref:acyltransferase n=1 Tax=Streptococcus thermophilus TaxID=1308 RepID=UPI0015C29261|nr:acyltransferase [Streptococcus thermophilus]MCE2282230.1 acyltransferase [Streptococcus thermophilus]MCE2285270.1 acyltransferase [Streptococcus thermophilus]CAD0147623.1 Galactoside O-acetyltransferase [Streptococcus thermophilus]CAD0150109.1 Galactoside O-acetyltransferase [Streptococcus thermophilus]